MAANRRRGAGLLASVAAWGMLLAGCANIPEESTPQAEPLPNGGAQPPGAIAQPDPKADPLALVRGFVGGAGNPDAARTYLTDEARQTWQGDTPPTIIEETFNTAPLPAQERKSQGDEQPNETTVVLTVTKVGRLGLDRSFIPAVGSTEYRVVLRRQSEGAPWRIQVPPDTVLITSADFEQSYKRVSVYFFDPELRVIVPDLRYVTALQPDGVPDRVIRLLLEGPSDTLADAVRSQLGQEAEIRTNAVTDGEGVLTVNLTKIGDPTPEARELIAAQIVLSLRELTQSKIRLMVDGHPLIAGHNDWRPSDIPSYDSLTRPNADLPGLFTSSAGRVHSLRDGGPVGGPAGSGEIKVQSAAQSLDGGSLAVVQEVPTGARLRIGQFGGALPEVDLQASTLTRPTWLLGTSTAPSNEVWTVQNGVDVVRVVRTGSGDWAPSRVNASDLRHFGTITDLRLSRDGVRLAAVANGQVVVASVVRDKDSVTIRSPRALQSTVVKNVVGVDWRSQDTIVVATTQSAQPVINIQVDGFGLEQWNGANLGSPVSAIAAAPDRDVIVADRSGMWTASEVLQVWRLQSQVTDAHPFYPG